MVRSNRSRSESRLRFAANRKPPHLADDIFRKTGPFSINTFQTVVDSGCNDKIEKAMENMMEDYENILWDDPPSYYYLERIHTMREADFSIASLDVGNQHKRQYILIDKHDGNCEAALDAIENKSHIGLCLTGMSLGRNGRVCWLQIEAGHLIMLFDVISLGTELFRTGSKMKEILESRRCCKVMHRCDFAADALQHLFDVELTNVLDTQMTEVELYQRENGLFLPKNVQRLGPMCMKYLNIYCEHIGIPNPTVKQVWTYRPLLEVDLEILCRRVMYLIPLCDELEGRLLELRKRMHDMRLNSIRSLESHDREFKHLNRVQSQNDLPLEFSKFTDLLFSKRSDMSRRHQPDKNGFVMNEILVEPKTNGNAMHIAILSYQLKKNKELAKRDANLSKLVGNSKDCNGAQGGGEIVSNCIKADETRLPSSQRRSTGVADSRVSVAKGISHLDVEYGAIMGHRYPPRQSTTHTQGRMFSSEMDAGKRTDNHGDMPGNSRATMSIRLSDTFVNYNGIKMSPVGKFEEEAMRNIEAGNTGHHMSAGILYATTARLQQMSMYSKDDTHVSKGDHRKNPIDWFIKKEVGDPENVDAVDPSNGFSCSNGDFIDLNVGRKEPPLAETQTREPHSADSTSSDSTSTLRGVSTASSTTPSGESTHNASTPASAERVSAASNASAAASNASSAAASNASSAAASNASSAAASNASSAAASNASSAAASNASSAAASNASSAAASNASSAAASNASSAAASNASSAAASNASSAAASNASSAGCAPVTPGKGSTPDGSLGMKSMSVAVGGRGRVDFFGRRKSGPISPGSSNSPKKMSPSTVLNYVKPVIGKISTEQTPVKGTPPFDAADTVVCKKLAFGESPRR